MIIATEMPRGSGHAPRENFKIIDAIWCVLMYYFDPVLKKDHYLLQKIPGYTLAMGDAPEKFEKTCSI